MRVARWTLGVVGDLLVTAGVLLLLFVGWQLWWTDVTADRTQDATVSTLARDFAATPPPKSEQPVQVPLGEAFAILRIPRLGAGYARPVLEGTGRATLEDGLGHYGGTAAPGAVGNFAVAGHRTTYGRPFHDIDRLRTGDTVVVETRAAYSVYAVKRHEIVAPSDVRVIAPVPDKPGVKPTERWMTMTACHPKYSAAQRYIVFAQLVKTYARADGLPVGTLAVPKGD